jgi:DNA-binding MarR family transcriptional regulator
MPRHRSTPGRASAPQDPLKLDLQMCFPLYAASRLMTRVYQPLLEPLGLTYPQYIVLMILWEDAPCPVSHIGARALLNTNTLTPLLKRLEEQGYVRRRRSAVDERVVEVSLSAAGQALKLRCSDIPAEAYGHLRLPVDKAMALKALLDELVGLLQEAPPP